MRLAEIHRLANIILAAFGGIFEGCGPSNNLSPSRCHGGPHFLAKSRRENERPGNTIEAERPASVKRGHVFPEAIDRGRLQ